MTTATKDKDDEVKKLRKGGRGITLKYDGECADCGAFLPKGTTARWYGRGRLYGYDCHSQKAPAPKPEPKPDPVQDDLWAGGAASHGTETEPEEYTPKKYDCTIH